MRNSLYRKAYKMRQSDPDHDNDVDGVADSLSWKEWTFENPHSRNPSAPPFPPNPEPTKIITTDRDHEE